jgi:hypothetical protein
MIVGLRNKENNLNFRYWGNIQEDFFLHTIFFFHHKWSKKKNARATINGKTMGIWGPKSGIILNTYVDMTTTRLVKTKGWKKQNKRK